MKKDARSGSGTSLLPISSVSSEGERNPQRQKERFYQGKSKDSWALQGKRQLEGKVTEVVGSGNGAVQTYLECT